MGKFSEMTIGKWAFDRIESERLKREGMKQAADNSASLGYARMVAKHIAFTRRPYIVTADDVGAELERRGYSGNLGPAAGSLFKGPEWEFTGQRIRSTRKSNHARELKVWRLK